MLRCAWRWLASVAVWSVVLASSALVQPPVGASPPAPGSVQVMFLPPPLEEGAVYSVGIYETKTGRLVRRLHEDTEDEAFTAGLNGLITFWDRKDDAGKIVPAGRYAARGWAVGEMKAEGEEILGNDWAAEDESLRVKHVDAICLVPADGGLVALVAIPGTLWEMLRLDGAGKILWRELLTGDYAGCIPALYLAENTDYVLVRWPGDKPPPGVGRTHFNLEGPKAPVIFSEFLHPLDPTISVGQDDTVWQLTKTGLQQFPQASADSPAVPAPGAAARRTLKFDPEEPVPRAVSASPDAGRLYLREESSGWQRVRGIEFSEAKQENGCPSLSEWKTFFERSIRRPDSALNLDENAPSPVIELPLVKNQLEPTKPQSVKLRAGFDATGSYLETADGLRLLPISARPSLRAARLARDPQAPDRLLFYQFDGAAWDVFSVTGAPRALVSFDAGELELTADGERRPEPPADEPRDP